MNAIRSADVEGVARALTDVATSTWLTPVVARIRAGDALLVQQLNSVDDDAAATAIVAGLAGEKPGAIVTRVVQAATLFVLRVCAAEPHGELGVALQFRGNSKCIIYHRRRF